MSPHSWTLISGPKIILVCFYSPVCSNSVVFGIASCPGVGKQVCKAKRRVLPNFTVAIILQKVLSRFPKELPQLTIGRISCRFARDYIGVMNPRSRINLMAHSLHSHERTLQIEISCCLYIWSVVPKLSSSSD